MAWNEYVLLGIGIAINIVGIAYSIFHNTNLFKCRNHKWVVTERSNALQQDEFGNPLRLVICRCHKCGKIDQQWIDVDVSELEELKSGKSFLLEWDWGVDMMNELKPEDVMRELERCDRGSSAACSCDECPYFECPVPCKAKLHTDTLALIREKDAEIERLKNSTTFQVIMPDDKVEEIKSACLKRVDELGNQRWISVKDRFPDPYEGVLIWGKDTGGVRWGMYSPYHSIWKDGTISHWMQLPEPPESEDDFPNCKISGCEAARKDCHIGCPYGKENTDDSGTKV